LTSPQRLNVLYVFLMELWLHIVLSVLLVLLALGFSHK